MTEHDKTLEDYLDGKSSVSRAYNKLDNSEPAAATDAAILAAARDAIDTDDNKVVQLARWRRWTLPTALAATVVVAVPLVVHVFDDSQVSPISSVEVRDPVAGESASPAILSDDAASSIEADAAADRQLVEAGALATIESTDHEKARAQLVEQAEENSLQDAGFAAAPPTAPAASVADRAERYAQQLPAPADSTTAQAGDNAERQIMPEPPQARADENLRARRDSREPAGSIRANRPDNVPPATPPHAAADSSSAWPQRSLSTAAEPVAQPESDPMAGRGTEQLASEAFSATAQPEQAGEVRPDTAALADTAAVAADSDLEEIIVVTGSRARPKSAIGGDSGLYVLSESKWARRIVSLHRSGQRRAARREFGEFLVRYPDAELPVGFPLKKRQAIKPKRAIVQNAEDWLFDIAQLADEGDNDEARMQLAEFLDIYQDYELPAWFPLTRDDAIIER
ncbi:MAG: hypothetical protein KJO55_09860 [Gammaproteobacteria bacterium]|nr:hypothetical protein [Gammaproteobacteria bacterium]